MLGRVRIVPAKWNVSLGAREVSTVRKALGESKNLAAYARSFDGSTLHSWLEAWEALVSTEWSDWDLSEYNNEIVCRDLIEVVLKNSSPITKAALAADLVPLDEMFQKAMKPVNFSNSHGFWRANSIHPEGEFA